MTFLTGRMRAGNAGSRVAFDPRTDKADPWQHENARFSHSQNVKVESLIMEL